MVRGAARPVRAALARIRRRSDGWRGRQTTWRGSVATRRRARAGRGCAIEADGSILPPMATKKTAKAAKRPSAKKKAAPAKKPAAKKPAVKKPAAKAAKKPAAKKAKASHAQRLVDHLRGTGARLSTGALKRADAKVEAALALAAADPVVRALVEVLVDRNSYFALSDVEVTSGSLLRGKREEGWNPGGKIIGPRDLAIAKNGAGDLYVWNADDGSVRFLVHDEGWVTRRRHDSVDEFLEGALWSALENLEPDDLEEMDDQQRADVLLATAIAGVEALNDDAREKLVELGVLSDE